MSTAKKAQKSLHLSEAAWAQAHELRKGYLTLSAAVEGAIRAQHARMAKERLLTEPLPTLGGVYEEQ